MTAKEIFEKHRIRQILSPKTISDENIVLSAMEEYGKIIHRNTRLRAIELINDLDSSVVQDSAIMNMPYEDVKPK